jgi:hypothetical protein
MTKLQSIKGNKGNGYFFLRNLSIDTEEEQMCIIENRACISSRVAGDNCVSVFVGEYRLTDEKFVSSTITSALIFTLSQNTGMRRD